MDWNYITGFFDADGSVTLTVRSKGRQRSPQISFHNNELSILVDIQSFIFRTLNIKGHISKKKKVKECHGQAYDLKYYDFNKCIKIIDNIKSIHEKKIKRFNIIREINNLTPRNGKYNDTILEKRNQLEIEFFK